MRENGAPAPFKEIRVSGSYTDVTSLIFCLKNVFALQCSITIDPPLKYVSEPFFTTRVQHFGALEPNSIMKEVIFV